MKDKAKTLRQSQTDAEKLLWQRIRNRQILNNKFRRQYIFGRYIVDFVCIEKKLIIEVDGGQHLEQLGYDQERTKYLERQGFKVLRFWNNEVLRQSESVLEKIYQSLV